MEHARQRDSKQTLPMVDNERATKRQGTLQKAWYPSSREVGVYIDQWLVTAGLAYNTVATENFKVLVHRLTGDQGATILAGATFRDLLEAMFAKFCKNTRKLFEREFKAAHGRPFLNVHHDGWTTGNGKVSVLGMSVSFIDVAWQHRELALLFTVGNLIHVSADVHKMILTRVGDMYGVAINAMSQFTMSDTTGARYALGIRENKETVERYDPKTNSRKREQQYCTIGGAFKEGRNLIKKVRLLNNYFSTQQRCKRLEEVQDFYCLPKMTPTLDCDTRIAFTVKLFKKTIIDYSALRGYFQNRDKGDDASVFDCISREDLCLVAEMEAIVVSIADLARIEVQRRDLVASELVVLLKYAADRVHSNIFSVYDITETRPTTTTVDTFPRRTIPVAGLSELARTCLARMKGQIKTRMATLTAETVLILYLDPRTKFSVESLEGEETEEEQRVSEVITAGKKVLLHAHREVFCSLNTGSNSAVEAAICVASTNFDLVPSAGDEKVICGAAIDITTADASPSLTFNEEADKALHEWLHYTVDCDLLES
ncbi:hypothetical protein V7S43_009216 [Phytophthora oleae]|uniref:Uncharacterized protein n=1 Tax=Phytophthora oleae TaxID=2107226 RepID=A0ABD3FH95_9STRA